MKEVVSDLAEVDRTSQLKNLKKVWKPTHKPFFDNECKEAFDKLSETATKQSLDLDNNFGDFKKFKRNNKKDCENYFKLLNDKRDAYNQKQIMKQERKEAQEAAIKEKENKAPLNTVDATVVNKKITFDEEGEEVKSAKKSSKKEKKKLDIDETIKKVDEKLKKESKKKKKEKKSKEAVST